MEHKEYKRYVKEFDEFTNNSIILEGINIDYKNKIVSVDLSHDKNVDTSILINPTYTKINDIDVISIFKRVRNENKSDGNPLIYALKGLHDWKINKGDILKLLKQFIRITEKIKTEYDTIITVPSSNLLNKEFLFRLNKIIKCKHKITDLFSKLEADEVFDVLNYSQIPRKELDLIKTSIERMHNENDGVFSFKYVPKYIRKYIKRTVSMTYINNELELQDKINEKSILILDDTISSGSTISEITQNILDMYTPSNVTVITLFSSL